MAYTTGIVRVFANKEITNEVLDQGDGIQTVFNMDLAKPPVFIDSLELKYWVSSTEYTATSDSAGDITGTHISSGTVDEAGNVDVTFSTAPDDLSDITASEYTAKGFLQKLIEFVHNSTHDETYGTGDGIDVTFPFALSNTPLSKGNLRLYFKIGTYEYAVQDNGAGEWIHALISASSINYSTAVGSVTFTLPLDDLYVGKIYYSTANGGTEGRDWSLYIDENAKDAGGSDAFPGLLLKQYTLANSGNNYLERFQVGFREFQRVVDVLYGVDIHASWNVFPPGKFDEGSWEDDMWNSTYNATTEHWSRIPHPALNDDEMTYWIMSDKSRIMGAIRISATVYETFYVGLGLRFSSPSKYPRPLIQIASADENLDFASTGNDRVYIADRRDSGTAYTCQIVKEDDTWINNNIIVLPRHDFVSSVPLKKTTDDKIPAYPILIYDDGDNELMMQLIGAFYFANENVVAEDLLVNGGDNYLVVQNVFRTDFFNYMCLLQE